MAIYGWLWVPSRGDVSGVAVGTNSTWRGRGPHATRCRAFMGSWGSVGIICFGVAAQVIVPMVPWGLGKERHSGEGVLRVNTAVKGHLATCLWIWLDQTRADTVMYGH